MAGYIGIDDILNATSRIGFDSFDGHTLQRYLEKAIKNGLDIKLEVRDETDLKDMMGEGVLILRSPMLGTTFMFVKVNAGTGFFGGQKAKVLSYLGDSSGSFTAGPVFNMFAMAITSINNIYRGAGILKGAAL